MKFIHIADVHLGVSPDAGSAYSQNRSTEIWNSFRRVIDTCQKEQADLLLIAGDLFHRQPLLRELKEVDYLFRTISETQVVFIAGNHDYLKSNSYYRTFTWSPNVHMILTREITCIELPEIETAVYGLSYDRREITKPLYDTAFAQRKQKYEILLAHGGDDSHIPFKKSQMNTLGYDYIALGHIHMPQELLPNRMWYAGALEPTDKNDVGAHGIVRGELDEHGCRNTFTSMATREYVHMDTAVHKEMTGFELRTRLKEQIETKGVDNIYKIRLIGYRDPDVAFDLSQLDVYGNIVEISDETKPAYDFQKLLAQNQDNLLGKYIESFLESEPGSEEYQALCMGVHALMETKRE